MPFCLFMDRLAGSNYIIGSVDSLTADVCSYETAAVARWFDTSCFFLKLVNVLIPPNPSSPSRCPFQIRCQYPRCHGPGKWLIVDPSSSIPCGLQGSVDSAVPSQCRRSIDCFWVDEHVFCLVEGWGWMGSWMARQHSGRESLVDSIRAGNVPMHGMHVIWTGNPHFERANLWAGQRGMRARVHPLATMHPCSQKSDSPVWTDGQREPGSRKEAVLYATMHCSSHPGIRTELSRARARGAFA